MYFGRYGPLEDIKIEKKLFLERLNYLIHTLERNNEKGKKEILEMDYTYDNWEIKSQEFIESFKIRIKNAFPKMLWFCLEDKYFILHIRMLYYKDFKINNFNNNILIIAQKI